MIDNKDILNFCDELNEIPPFVNVLDDLALYSNVDKLSDNVNRKFEESFDINDYEALTQNGYVSIKKIGKTIPYLKYKIKTKNHSLECADDHIVIDDAYTEIFAKDLNKDDRPDKVVTESGPETVLEVINTGEYENMYDIELEEGSDNLYYTNGILSHNSIWLANDAATFVKMGYNTAVITAEMAAHKFIKRIGSNLLNVKMSDYDAKVKDNQFMKTALSRVGVGLQPPGNLHVKKYPTSQATVIDIENYLLDIEETTGTKLKAIIIDYINILANYRNLNGDNTYMKIKQIAEDLRAMGDRNDWLIVTATQIKRCLTLDTVVTTELNGNIEIKELTENDNILTEDGFKPVKRIHPIEKQKVFLIKTKSGKTIKMSGNHITPTTTGDKTTLELSVGDLIYIKSKIINKLNLEEDAITDIIELEDEDTLDIEIDSKSRCFFANEILTHNSGYESSNISMDDIAESAGLSHTADMMYGIIQDPIMHANYEYWLKILKIRDGDGKNTKCRFNIDYSHMRLTETDDVRSPGGAE